MLYRRELARSFYIGIGPRKRHPRWALVLGVLLLVTLVVVLLVIARDGRPTPIGDDSEGILRQSTPIEVAITISWLLFPVLAMWAFGVRTAGEDGEPLRFGRLPGGRLTVAYAIWLCFTSVAFALLGCVLGGLFSTPSDLDGFEGGAPEAFGWLFIRGALGLGSSVVLSALLLGWVIVAHAVVTQVRAWRGTAAPHEVAGTRFMLGVMLLLIFVVGFAVSLAVDVDRQLRAVVSLSTAVAISGTTALLFTMGTRAARKAARTGGPDWTEGLVRKGMSTWQIVAAGATLVVTLLIYYVREFG